MYLNRYAKDQSIFATNVGGFFPRDQALLLALKPKWKMFIEFKYLTSVRL